jgi:lipopolysaccharide export system permease protein
VLVHDNRNLKAPITYLAESGRIVQTPAGMRLVMYNGTVERGVQERRPAASAAVQTLPVRPRPVHVSSAGVEQRKAKERYLGELLESRPRI